MNAIEREAYAVIENEEHTIYIYQDGEDDYSIAIVEHYSLAPWLTIFEDDHYTRDALVEEFGEF